MSQDAQTTDSIQAPTPRHNRSLGRQDNEIVWKAHPSQIVNVGPFLVAGAFIGCALAIYYYGLASPERPPWTYEYATAIQWTAWITAGAALLYGFWKWLTIRFHNYELTEQRLRLSTGILVRRRHQLELFRVMDIAHEIPLIYRPFGVGDLLLLTADNTHPRFLMRAIPDHDHLYEQLRTLVQQARGHNRVGMIEGGQ